MDFSSITTPAELIQTLASFSVIHPKNNFKVPNIILAIFLIIRFKKGILLFYLMLHKTLEKYAVVYLLA